MKIAVIGYSGSGKSTLARNLGERLDIPVLHLDRIQFTPGWKERDREEGIEMVRDFMEGNGSWIIDGTYKKFLQERRLREANVILFLDLSRLSCLRRACARQMRYHGRVREDMADGCMERMDLEFFWWLLWRGRTGKRRRAFEEIVAQYPEKTVRLKSQRDIDRYLEGLPCWPNE